MNIIEIPKTKSTFSIEPPLEQSTNAIIFLPGISGEVFSERFKLLVDAGNVAGFTVARISAWKNGKDVAQKSLETLHDDIAFVINYLREHGYVSISAVAKSFGGTVLLTLPLKIQNELNREILWSPVIGVDDNISNIDTYISKPLGILESLKDLLVNQTYLKNKILPSLIIHGDADENIELSNSERLASIMPNTQVLSVSGADHSYSEKEHQEKLINATIDFLK